MDISKMGQRVNDHASLKTLKITSAMEAGIADHVWSLEEVVRVDLILIIIFLLIQPDEK